MGLHVDHGARAGERGLGRSEVEGRGVRHIEVSTAVRRVERLQRRGRAPPVEPVLVRAHPDDPRPLGERAVQLRERAPIAPCPR